MYLSLKQILSCLKKLSLVISIYFQIQLALISLSNLIRKFKISVENKMNKLNNCHFFYQLINFHSVPDKLTESQKDVLNSFITLDYEL